VDNATDLRLVVSADLRMSIQQAAAGDGVSLAEWTRRALTAALEAKP